jgi:hypothetical protein
MTQGLREPQVSRGRDFIKAWTDATMASTQTQDEEDGNEDEEDDNGDEEDDNEDEEDDNGDDNEPSFVKTRTQTRVSLFLRRVRRVRVARASSQPRRKGSCYLPCEVYQTAQDHQVLL